MSWNPKEQFRTYWYTGIVVLYCKLKEKISRRVAEADPVKMGQLQLQPKIKITKLHRISSFAYGFDFVTIFACWQLTLFDEEDDGPQLAVEYGPVQGRVAGLPVLAVDGRLLVAQQPGQQVDEAATGGHM